MFKFVYYLFSYNELNMKKNSEQGSVLIGVLLSLGLAAFAYIGSSTSFFKSITRQKSKTQLDVLSKSLTNAVFNYTAYAVKERWCMDANWGRDTNCGGAGGSDMKAFVTHPRNLERFLWSKVTINDMASRYKGLYGAAPAALALNKLEQVIPMSNLESLGASHPLNLVMDDMVKQCLTSVSVLIEKPLSSYYKPQGDEVYLIITVKGNLTLNPLSRCSLLKNTPVIKGLVIVYPKTLNQYAMVKVEDFTVSDYGSSNKGLNFFGPVYIQRNVKLPASGKHGVSFKDKVRIGEGILQLNGQPFTPKTPGGFSDQYLSQITTMNGFMNGISLEAEADLGLPKLFGGTYKYPDNVNMAMCTNRKALKDNFSLTKDSRLWLKGKDGNFTFALSEDNEFREYIRHGANADNRYIYNEYTKSFSFASPLAKNTFDVDVKEEAETAKPIMEVKISVDGKTYSTVYLGRSSEAKVSFGKASFFQGQKNLLDTSETTYLDINKVDADGMGINDDLKNEYYTFQDECREAKDDDIYIPECQKVRKTAKDEETDCNLIPATKPVERLKCKDAVDDLKKAKDKYFAKEKKLVNDLNNFISNIPSVTLKTTEVLSNKEDVSINWVNKESFKYPFVSGLDSIKFKFNVYDFAIEDSNDTTSGQRAGREKRLPGPNSYTGENSIVFDITRDKFGEVSKFLTKKNDGSILNADSGKGTTLQTWNKSYYYTEPPGNYPDADKISYPTDGLSVAEAKKLDEVCDIDTTVIPPPSWDVSFTEHTQFSWLYNVTNSGLTITDPSKVQPMPTYTFTNADMAVGNYQGVPNRSIVKECIVPSSLDLVFGFYVCETLRVQSRTRPLNFVGTFIVKNLNIDSSALSNGVNFYSIWSTGGVELLRANKHLRREKAATDDCVFDKPGWFTGLDEDYLADYQTCSPSKFLYQGANNFNWTTVDPEIGITDAKAQVTTQSKIANRYRRYGVNVVWLRNGIE